MTVSRKDAELAFFEHRQELGWNHECHECDELWQAVVDAWHAPLPEREEEHAHG